MIRTESLGARSSIVSPGLNGFRLKTDGYASRLGWLLHNARHRSRSNGGDSAAATIVPFTSIYSPNDQGNLPTIDDGLPINTHHFEPRATGGQVNRLVRCWGQTSTTLRQCENEAERTSDVGMFEIWTLLRRVSVLHPMKPQVDDPRIELSHRARPHFLLPRHRNEGRAHPGICESRLYGGQVRQHTKRRTRRRCHRVPHRRLREHRKELLRSLQGKCAPRRRRIVPTASGIWIAPLMRHRTTKVTCPR